MNIKVLDLILGREEDFMAQINEHTTSIFDNGKLVKIVNNNVFIAEFLEKLGVKIECV